MPDLHFRSRLVQYTVFVVTAVFCLLGALLPGVLAGAEGYLVLGFMLILGLPHGATDHSIFRAVDGERASPKVFYLMYFAVIAAYGLLWWVLPVVAFTVFLVLALYHFGQSNWTYVNYAKSHWAIAHYLLWGGGVLLTPILLHATEAQAIIVSMTGWEIPIAWVPTWLPYLVGGLAVVNFLAIILLWRADRLTDLRYRRELLSYGLLTAMFLTNSLLIGFTIYFVFWHSLGSLLDQYRFFRLRRLREFHWSGLAQEVLPVIAGACLFCAYVWYAGGGAAVLEPIFIGRIFIFISLLTLPHMLLVDALYRRDAVESLTTAVTKTITRRTT